MPFHLNSDLISIYSKLPVFWLDGCEGSAPSELAVNPGSLKMRLWLSLLTFMILSFLMHEMGIIIIVSFI